MKKFLFLLSIFSSIASSSHPVAPKLTVIIVIDQFAAHIIPKLRPHLTGGIKFLSEEGISYANAFYDHSMPGTGPGHALLATGTYGSFHGIVNNYWFSPTGKKITCDESSVEEGAVFAPHGVYPYGKSAKQLLVDTLSDQMMLHSYPHATNNCWALSLKSRSAVMMAGHLGKAIWFDDVSGNFTSSKAYFESLPSWLTTFNETNSASHASSVTWKPFFETAISPYDYNQVNNYTYSPFKKSILNQPFSILAPHGVTEIFEKTPTANQLLMSLAQECIQQNYTGKETDRFVLWLSLSSLDKVGHAFGPYSKEAIDIVYHMDYQLKEFMEAIYGTIPPEDVLFVFTGDHGIQPIPEILREQGLTIARRYQYPHIIEHLNTIIEKKYGVPSIIQNFKEPQFYLNQATLATLSSEQQQVISDEIKEYMLSLPGVRRAWTFDELRKETFESYDTDRYLQRQLYKGRSGQIFYSVSPYTTIDTYFPNGKSGTSHITQYAYDTQVPLIFYQKGKFTRKRVVTNVSLSQVSVSLATLFDVPRPSAATANVLPELPL